MPERKTALVEGNFYHICNKSIEGFVIFRNPMDYNRMLSTLDYYTAQEPPLSFSAFQKVQNGSFVHQRTDCLVKIIGYCLMPTHLHLILKQTSPKGISDYMQKVCNSYTKFFNAKYKRKGPLWVNRFTSVFIESDEQLLHLTRYLHLNPTTSFLVDKPEKWEFSSYREYIGTASDKLCEYSKVLNINKTKYIDFVACHIDDQRRLAQAKRKLSFLTPGV